MDQASAQQIENAYISVELKADAIKRFRSGLRESFQSQGIACEDASANPHVSIAYGEGHVGLDEIGEVAEEIASTGFQVRAKSFELLSGQTTNFDYLVICVESSGDFANAVDLIEDHMQVKTFEGGFKSHVSLLKFEKGSLARDAAEELVRELNASQGAVFALGRCLCLEGQCVCVFGAERQCCLRAEINGAAAAVAA